MSYLKQALCIWKKLNKQEKEKPMWEGFEESAQKFKADIADSLIFSECLSPADAIDEFGFLRAQVDGSDVVIELHGMGNPLVLTPNQARILLAWLENWAKETTK